ncbi:hypothetical protein ColLi_01010 [Colletotrichum liriopes]|uniref:C6 zinc finger domain protein n=1 Tax=Colletotrichum liriopes TaxID=708192 RepID=A0AA37GCJ4_9PEZI|nr:hypothetical protein ColLi_01010 [Colletotrichum liriopes]
MVGPVLSGPMDTYFWTHLVVQFSHFEPAVRHAVLAISSLYEDFHGGARVTRQKPGNDFALRHYGAAIQRIKSAEDEQLVLLVCILFICIEYLQGDVEAALRHCKHGIMILNRVGCSSWALEYLMPIFRRLSFASFYLGVKPPPDATVPGLIGFEVPILDKFESVAEAQSAIDDLTVHMIGYVSSGNTSPADRQDTERRLQQFHTKLSDFSANVPSSESSTKIAICNMMMKFEMARIQIDTINGTSETRFDEHTEGFRRIIALARHASQLKETFPDERPKACFTFESGFLSTLGFISIKSRDLQIRLESLALMVDIAAPKEGFVDVGTLYRVGRLGVELEHGISLEDGTIEKDPAAFAEFSFPPEEKRFFASPIDHELDVIKNEDGSVTYRRTVSFLRRDVEGNIHARQEYITDAIPGQVLPNIPCMRCSKPM